MKKMLPLLFAAFVIGFASCKKEECAECFTEITDTLSVKDTVNLGELCGEDLDNTDGNTFTNGQGFPARSYCNR
jgi:hypothetical protein